MGQSEYLYMIIAIACIALSAITGQVDDKESASVTKKYAMDDMWLECELSQEERPDYYFFVNAQQAHYSLTLEYEAACAIKDFMIDTGMEDEEWELKRIYYYEDASRVYVESKTRNELYMLLTDGPGIDPRYIIMADIRKGDEGDVILGEGDYSYNSTLEWHSFMDLLEGKEKEEGEEPFKMDAAGYLHDPIYNAWLAVAISDYVDMTGGNKKLTWEIDDNDTYIGRNGYIVCANCSNGIQDVIFLVDVWNKTYAVVE